jgi:NADH:ubiquinone oxidoreductase subunit
MADKVFNLVRLVRHYELQIPEEDLDKITKLAETQASDLTSDLYYTCMSMCDIGDVGKTLYCVVYVNHVENIRSVPTWGDWNDVYVDPTPGCEMVELYKLEDWTCSEVHWDVEK